MPRTQELRSAALVRAAGVAGRIAFAVLMVLTSFYGVLAYIPDTYIAFIQAPFQSWIPLLMRYHAVVFGVAAAGLAASLWRDSAGDVRVRRMVIEFVAVALLFCLYSLSARPFAGLRNDSISFVWALAVVFPILWIGLIDWQLYWRKRKWTGNLEGVVRMRDALTVAAAIGVVYPGAAFARYVINGYSLGMDRSKWLVWAGSICGHVLFFTVLFGAIALAESVAGRTAKPGQTRFLLRVALAWACVGLVIERIAFAAIPYRGTEAVVYAVWSGLALAVFGGGVALRSSVLAGDTVKQRSRKPGEIMLVALVLVIATFVVPAFIGVIDWNSILERTWVLVFWTLALLALIRFGSRGTRPLPLVPALMTPVLAYGLFAVSFGSRMWSSPDSGLNPSVERHAYFDVSFATLRDLMGSHYQAPCDELCDYLHVQTNIPPWMPGPAPEINVVDHLQPATGSRPNIFVIVVDSLSADFLTPYNPAENTPEIAAFARDAVVFRNAFSRYAGTTLAEPAIWAGGMLLHTHYPQPFSRVNNLEKLVVADGYQPFVTVDTTLRMLLRSMPGMVRLDTAAAKWTDVDLCSTTDDLVPRVLARRGDSRPIFMFTQPQNVHLITVQKRHPELLVHTQEALKKVYRQDLRRLDGCFGNFVRFLKSQNLFDNSIIVLTADHGEFGHDSHATSVEPEIMRVPLIMHLPGQVKSKYHFDTNRVAFTTDITPTLYYLLGHRPIRKDELIGRPLFTETADEAAQYERETYLVASSYAPNYGVLRDNGRTLFTVDDRKRSYALYDIGADPTGDRNLLRGAPEERDKAAIRKHVEHIAASYKFKYKRPSLLKWFLQ